MERHQFEPRLYNKNACVHCSAVMDDPIHADDRHREAKTLTVPITEPLPQRMAAMEREKERVLDRERSKNDERIAMAREIARLLWTKTHEPIMVWQIQDYWVANVRNVTWADENGKTYWAGAIFSKKEWRCVGMGKSPYNHNDSNKKWELLG